MLMTDVKLLRAFIADPEATESIILPFPKDMHTFSLVVVDVPNIGSMFAVLFQKYL